jgi:hypothetical protein
MDILVKSEVLVKVESGARSKIYKIPYPYISPGPDLMDYARANIFKTMLQGRITILEVQLTVPYWIKKRGFRKPNQKVNLNAKKLTDIFLDDDDYESPFDF